MNFPAWMRRDSGKRAQEFKEWINAKIDARWMQDYASYTNEHPRSNTNQYIEDWIKQCADIPTILPISTQPNLSDGLINNLGKADKFGLRIDINQLPISVSGKFIDLFQCSGDGRIHLEDCAIRTLIFHGTSRDVTLKNCTIGTMQVKGGSLATFELIGGSISRIFAPTPTGPSPFTGSVEVRGVELSAAFENAQAYRNLRHHLSALHNHEAASVFHAAEMEAEVGRQSLVDKSISFLYRLLANYGGSSARPLLIFFAALVAYFGLLLLTDGVTPVGRAVEAEGWHHYLFGFEYRARILRAAVFSISQVFNPLGIFGTRLLLLGKTPMIASASAVLGLVTTMTFALFVLAVRRRFKLDRAG